MNERIADVAIIGAGPAGSTAAQRLAAGGASVLLFDHSHPREKPCGGGISARARNMFPELDALANLGKTGTSLRLISPGGRVNVVKGGGNTFAIDREILDGRLLANAVASGAEHVAQKVLNIEKQTDGWSIATPGDAFRAKALIGADGVFSLVRKKLIGPIDREHLGFGAHMLFKHLDPPTAVLQFFGDRRGYAWVFNRRDQSSLGVGMPHNRKSDWQPLLRRLVSEHAPGFSPRPIRGWCLPQAASEDAFQTKLSGDDWCLIGDAAGHVDPLTGEGILYSLWGAQIAAECLQGGILSTYDVRWREAFLPRFIKHMKMAFVLGQKDILESILTLGRLPFVGKWLYKSLTSAD